MREADKDDAMQRYVILCYHDEETVNALTSAQESALMADLEAVRRKLETKLGPVARLMPTTAATTFRPGNEAMVIDGPFAETKEALLGFYIIECPSLEEAMEATRMLIEPRKRAGLMSTMEIRPISLFYPGKSMT